MQVPRTNRPALNMEDAVTHLEGLGVSTEGIRGRTAKRKRGRSLGPSGEDGDVDEEDGKKVRDASSCASYCVFMFFIVLVLVGDGVGGVFFVHVVLIDVDVGVIAFVVVVLLLLLVLLRTDAAPARMTFGHHLVLGHKTGAE